MQNVHVLVMLWMLGMAACGATDETRLAQAPELDATAALDATPTVPDSGADQAASSAVVPVCDAAQLCVFAWRDLRFVVDAAKGGRIIELSMGGTNVLVAQGSGAPQYGSTFWTSPQADWTWPPPAALDTGAYTARINGALLELDSGSFSVQSHSMTVTKRFRVSSQTGVVSIEYAIMNDGASAVTAAPWEISRVAPRGLTFFPNPASGQLLYPGGTFAALPAQDQDGYTFVSDAAAGTDQKLFADGGAKGYLAHLTQDLLFVKAWADVPSASRAPGEAEVEIYAQGAGTYVELENQGPYAPIAPGGRATWQVRWSLSRLASATTARQALEQAADAMAAK